MRAHNVQVACGDGGAGPAPRRLGVGAASAMAPPYVVRTEVAGCAGEGRAAGEGEEGIEDEEAEEGEGEREGEVAMAALAWTTPHETFSQGLRDHAFFR